MADDTMEKFINPYTDLDNLDFLDETKVNWDSEESKKVFWDNYSVMKAAVDKGFQKGILKEKKPATSNGGVAQLGEHLLCKQGVRGSIPLISTKRWAHSSAG